jgi:DNA helicase II / ATP-dependent DNA helicase PcrA
MHGIYRQLFEQNINTNGEILPSDWERICAQTIGKLNSMIISYEDAAPFAYLQDLIEGRESNTGIRHIFIDEAQDYTPFQFAFIQRLFPYSKMTLLGDFNQAIFSGATGSATVLTDLEIVSEEVETFVLNKTYRSTKEIVEFTSALINSSEKIIPFNRSGRKPTILRVNNSNIHGCILEKIKEFQRDGNQTVAVICRTAKESRIAFEALKKEKIALHLIEKGTISYEKGILVIPSYLAKGIEFDAAILYDVSQYKRESERKLLYTVCTRAMHELYMFTTDGISPLMKDIQKNFYIIED